jgi:hypothetical protein
MQTPEAKIFFSYYYNILNDMPTLSAFRRARPTSSGVVSGKAHSCNLRAKFHHASPIKLD